MTSKALLDRHPCSVLVLDDEDVLERHVAPHVGRLQRHELAARRRALVRHARLVLHLQKERRTTFTGRLWCWITFVEFRLIVRLHSTTYRFKMYLRIGGGYQ